MKTNHVSTCGVLLCESSFECGNLVFEYGKWVCAWMKAGIQYGLHQSVTFRPELLRSARLVQ